MFLCFNKIDNQGRTKEVGRLGPGQGRRQRGGYNPDSNFSLQQACHKFVMTRVQACRKLVMTRVQACSKLTKASKSPWNELAASLPCKLIANYSKNRVRTQPGIELATSLFRSGDANH
ncbi:hypothetical protein AVEN_88298-1 [Araneus ventricosus]|uniref:Uncharacterized protein n=1 Tax=Araneus ventricosus TaxID=182803 RepID=A0A4Y2ACF9_ARAVE|nr:hypothetical protein AVEN_88298-1 [Araneus ventricosus]